MTLKHIAFRERVVEMFHSLCIAVGEDPTREGLEETSKRLYASLLELLSGYKQDVSNVITTFDNEGYNEIVLLKNIEFVSLCEHHVLPFSGVAHIAYIPDKKILGLSKLARILDIYSHRLQVQERLTCQVTNALDTYVKPLGSACIVEAQHLCIQCRGVQKKMPVAVTSSLSGVFLSKSEAKQELFSLIRKE